MSHFFRWTCISVHQFSLLFFTPLKKNLRVKFQFLNGTLRKFEVLSFVLSSHSNCLFLCFLVPFFNYLPFADIQRQLCCLQTKANKHYGYVIFRNGRPGGPQLLKFLCERLNEQDPQWTWFLCFKFCCVNGLW